MSAGRLDVRHADLRPADILFTHNPSWLGKAIRWSTTAAGESPSYANHVAIVGRDGIVIEALWKVVATPWPEWVVSNSYFQLWRNTKLSMSTCLDIANNAENYMHRSYGWWKLGAHFGDCLLGKMFGGNPYLFRRLLCLDDYPICSWVAACAYAKQDIQFGGSSEAIDPDSMLDFVISSSDWELKLAIS